MNKLIMDALMLDARSKEAKAVANLTNYIKNSAGVGEHPDIVTECMKLVKDIAEARELIQTVKSLEADEFYNR